MTKEFLIGLVFLTATAIVAFVTATVQNWNPFTDPKIVYVDFNRINDLARNNDVTYAGFKIGYVGDINFIQVDKKEKIRISMVLVEGTEVPSNAIVTIQDRSVLGGKKISILRPKHPLPPAQVGHIFVGKDPIPLTEAAGDAALKFGEGIDEIKDLLLDIKEGKGTMGLLFTDTALYENYNRTGANLSEITDKINRGDGSLGKLVNESDLYDDAETLLGKLTDIHLDIVGDVKFFPEDDYSLTEFGLRITTSPTKYYEAKASIFNTNHNTRIATNRTIARQEDTVIYPTVLLGRKFLEDRNLELGLGLIEGELGGRVGLKMILHDEDQLWAHFEARNRIRDKDIRENTSSGMARVWLTYEKHFDEFPSLRVFVGGHNLMDDAQGFAGFGFTLRDDDIKYLASLLGGAG